MLIIEIILTFVAWGRGWKWLALLPLGIAFGIGLIAGASGASMDDLAGLIWIDVVAIIALIVMVVKQKPGTEKEKVEEKVDK